MEPTFQDIRNYLVEELRKDLLGPIKIDEELIEGPTSYYLTGILFPANTDINPEEDNDSGEVVLDDDDIDTGTLMATATNPSSIGLTFSVDAGEVLCITPSAAIYEEDKQENGYPLWKRQQCDIKPLTLSTNT